MFGKTPWVDRAFLAFWDRVKAAAPRASWVPRLEEGKTPSVVEFGCGVYGCAVPTHDPNVLVKMTSDPSEAAFAVIAMKLGSWPPGIVRYYAAYNVPNVTYKKRPVAILWRDEATDVGNVVKNAKHDPQQAALVKSLVAYLQLAGSLRELILAAAKRHPEEPWRLIREAEGMRAWAAEAFEELYEAGRIVNYSGGEKIAGILRLLALIEDEMRDDPFQHSLGEALSFYRRHGIVLADVNLANIGRRGREIVITDPGHAVPLERDLARVSVPALP